MLKILHIALASLVVVPVLILSVFIAIIPAALLRLFKANRAADRWTRVNGTLVARIILWSLNTRIHADGMENIPQKGTPICFMANHQSLLDPFAVVAGLHIWAGFITKRELKKVPLVNFWIESINCVYIDRKSPRSSIGAILKGVDNIRKGIPMFVFPEGTRSKSGGLGEFKSGSLKLATRAKAVIVPIAISGSRNAFEDKRGIRPVHIWISVCKPIPTEQLTDAELKTLPDTVYHTIQQRYDQLTLSHT